MRPLRWLPVHICFTLSVQSDGNPRWGHCHEASQMASGTHLHNVVYPIRWGRDDLYEVVYPIRCIIQSDPSSNQMPIRGRDDLPQMNHQGMPAIPKRGTLRERKGGLAKGDRNVVMMVVPTVLVRMVVVVKMMMMMILRTFVVRHVLLHALGVCGMYCCMLPASAARNFTCASTRMVLLCFLAFMHQCGISVVCGKWSGSSIVQWGSVM